MDKFLILLMLIILIVVLVVIFYKKKENRETFKSSGDEYSVAKHLVYVPSKNEKTPYDPIVRRPIQESVRPKAGNCTKDLFPHRTSKDGRGEMTVPCNLKAEGKKYAMRPILNSNDYHEMLEYLFDAISEDVVVNDTNLVYPEEFSNEEEYKKAMHKLMKKIHHGVKTLPLFVDYAKKDTWNGEQFAFLNEKVFVYQQHDLSKLSQQQKAFLARNGGMQGTKKFIISFTLYNTRRTVSTDIVAEMYLINKHFKIKNISFASKKPDNKFVEGITLSGKRGIDMNNNNLQCSDHNPDWIFGNTLFNQGFTRHGFHSTNPKENHVIKGGVPDELIPLLKKCDNGYLLNCGTPNRLPGGNDMQNTVYNEKGQKWHYTT